MAGNKYIFDPRSFSFREAGRDAWRAVRAVLLFTLITLAIALVLYGIFALAVNTDTEKRLKRENRSYEKVLPSLEVGSQMLLDAISGLQYKDNAIYNDVFHTDAPSIDPVGALDGLFGSDTIPDTKLVSYTLAKSEALQSEAAVVEKMLLAALRSTVDSSFSTPPMRLPLKNLSYTQVGASAGKKLNPFYKAYVQHGGLDLIAMQGDPVYAPLAGTVKEINKSSKGEGNTITISHSNGWTTRYTHLSEILVKESQTVKAGTKIGTVGMSGAAFAPHLHYEVLKDGERRDPVGFIFSGLSPEEYANMYYMAANTEQSMD